ncbi:MAG TPA: ribonuclease Z [Ktedonobacteraceae bacterium]|jgi:ribonuclease BN (tRNA processing enzyme)|nr:ribonuclease Z [Ktedonobacteraceae bacterium]
MSSLTLLGTGTCQIEFERRASSVLLEFDNTYILFDCGHGVVQRLLEVGVQHNQVHHIVLSHFHADHVSDLIPFLQAGAWSQQNPRTQDLHIYGPAGVKRMVDGLIALFGERALKQPSYAIHVHEIAAGAYTIGSFPVEAASLPPSGNHGLSFSWRDKRYAITGDSYFHDEEIAFLSDVDVAIIDSGHIKDDEIVQLAARSQARTLICSHLYRALDVEQLQTQAVEQGYTGNITVGRDFMSFVL